MYAKRTSIVIFEFENNTKINELIQRFKKFHIHIFCGNKNEISIKHCLFNVNDYTISNLGRKILDIDIFLTSMQFWNSMKYENIVIIKSYNEIIKNSKFNESWINNFMKYNFSFLGPPINYQEGGEFLLKHIITPKSEILLNGEISIRKKTHMINCLKNVSKKMIMDYRKKYDLDNIYFYKTFIIKEEYYFSHSLELLGYNIPSKILSQNFANANVPTRILFIDIMNINYTINTPFVEPLGGTQSSLCYFLIELSRQYPELEIYLMNRNKHINKSYNIEVIPLGDDKNVVIEKIKEIQPKYIFSVNNIELLDNLYKVFQKNPILSDPKLYCWMHDDINQKTALYLKKMIKNEKPLSEISFIFVSHWQKNEYIKEYDISKKKTYVIKNALAKPFLNLFKPEDNILKWKKPIMAYTSTPYRGLKELLLVFPKIKEIIPELELHVYSSMKVYQNEETQDYAELYEKCKNMDGVVYIGSISQPELSKKLKEVLIFGYPNVFRETFCISIAEAMASGCYIISNNYGALQEISSDFGLLLNTDSGIDAKFLSNFGSNIVQIYKMYKEGNINLENHLKNQVRYMNENCRYDIRSRKFYNHILTENGSSYLNIVKKLFSEGKYDESINLCNKFILSGGYQNDELYHILGANYYEKENYIKSATCYDNALKINPYNEKYFTNNFLNFKKSFNKINNIIITTYLKKLLTFKKQGNKTQDLGDNIIQSMLSLCSHSNIELYKEILKICLDFFPNEPSYILKNILICPKLTVTEENARTYQENFIKKAQNFLKNTKKLPAKNHEKNVYHIKNFHLNMYIFTISDIDQKLISSLISKCYLKLWPKLNYVNPNLHKPNPSNTRIAFLSELFRNHSSSKLIRGLICNLKKHNFHIILLRLPICTINTNNLSDGNDGEALISGYSDDHITKDLIQHSDEVIKIGKSLNILDIQKELSLLNIDILVYPELGQSIMSYCLAFSRIAPIQLVHSWGHPVISEIKTIDHTISMDIDDTESHGLVKFKELSSYFYKPTIADPSCLYSYAIKNNINTEEITGNIKLYDREDFIHGMGENIIYLCIQNFWKFNINFTEVCCKILKENSTSILILINKEDSLKDIILKQISELKSRVGYASQQQIISRIIFLPPMDHRKLLGLISISDVILDSFHWSGGITNFESFSLSKPIVTLSTRYLCGRLTYAMYKKMNILECITYNKDEYVNMALKLGNNKEFRDSVIKKIEERKGILFENNDTILEWVEFLRQSVTKI